MPPTDTPGPRMRPSLATHAVIWGCVVVTLVLGWVATMLWFVTAPLFATGMFLAARDHQRSIASSLIISAGASAAFTFLIGWFFNPLWFVTIACGVVGWGVFLTVRSGRTAG